MYIAYFTETELSETSTEKGGKMEESNQHDSEQEKEGKERREGREGERF